MDSDPMISEPETLLQSHWIEPRTLNRWDRIPVATFRRTREKSLIEGTTSDTNSGSKYTGLGVFVQDDMLGIPKIRAGKKGSSKRSKGRRDMIISPVLLPIRDEESIPINDSPSSSGRNRFEKSRKELRKEKAMMKRKMTGKNIHLSQRHQQHHHRHHPNMKTRGSNSMQRTHSTNSHVPRLSL